MRAQSIVAEKGDGRVAVDLMTRLLWVTLYPQPGKREQWILLLYLVPSFYSVQDPSQWNCSTHIQGGSPSVSLCGNAQRGVFWVTMKVSHHIPYSSFSVVISVTTVNTKTLYIFIYHPFMD